MSGVFDHAAATYGTIGPDFFSYFGRLLVERLAINPSERVLDLACGTGAALIPAAERVGPMGQAVGVDLSEPMLRRARQRIVGLRADNACVARMDAQELGFGDERFDVCVSGFALGSFRDPAKALEECRRVLRRRGRLGLSVADRWWWEGDRRWGWHAEVLSALGVWLQPDRFGRPQAVVEVLKASDWTEAHAELEEFDLRFSDADEWWAWVWSHGYRQILERMSPSQLRRYRAVAYERLQDRPISGQLEVVIATATKPHE